VVIVAAEILVVTAVEVADIAAEASAAAEAEVAGLQASA